MVKNILSQTKNRIFSLSFVQRCFILLFCLLISLFFLTGETWGRYTGEAGGKDSIALAGFDIGITQADVRAGTKQVLANHTGSSIELKDFTLLEDPQFMDKASVHKITIRNNSPVSVRVSSTLSAWDEGGVYRWFMLPGDLNSGAEIRNKIGTSSSIRVEPGHDSVWTLAVWAEQPEGELKPEVLDAIPSQAIANANIIVKQITE